MGWSDEVHARRTLEIREYVRQQKAAGPYAVPELKGNSSLLSLVTLTGALAARAAWQREGRYLRGKDIRRIPFVGPWLAEHVPRWRDDQRKAGAAAARRARLSQAQATAHSAASASSQHASATGSSAASTPASTARMAAEQQQAAAGSRKQRNRKRAKRR